MNINTREMGFLNFNKEEMQWFKFNGVPVYESATFEELIKTGITPFQIYSSGADLVNYKMYGNAEQDGTPTPTTPIEIKTVGEYDETTGKYKIPVKVSNEKEAITTNIYLNEPLRKIGEYADYLDFKNKKIVRVIENRLCSELAFEQHQSYSYIYSVNSARFKKGTGLNPISKFFDSTRYAPGISIKNMTVDYCIKMHATNSALYISDSVHTTEKEFNEFVKDKTIQYVLATPIEETIELPSIATLKGNVTIEIVDDIQPSNMEIVYEGKE